eukprot:CAMPEP_0206272812 /NCGR_PEP_ID=MMETSP0047_2-20121206/34214_1 /ASSEMBLY_ACC=CAM_ASM_000192 /TAXON_ID=195065 /ORGANISM="Chroomonas mesostigmatica_cf, Strain CCMP1168" /LENGTH=528 /DNA_ID=CAMNT_0053701771 /DNA_START=68 /DNA_END=1652 /DNA_ORIENTATION=+
MDDSSEGSMLNDSRSPSLHDRDDSFQRRLDKGKDALASYLLSRQVPQPPAPRAAAFSRQHQAEPRSSFLRGSRLSSGSEDDGMLGMDLVQRRPSTARGGSAYGAGVGLPSATLEHVSKRMADLEEHCIDLERALRDKADENELLQQQSLRVRKEREEVLELFEGAMERVRALETTLAVQKRSAEDVVADTDEQNEELRMQVRLLRERCKDWGGAQDDAEIEKLDEVAGQQRQLIAQLKRELQVANVENESLRGSQKPPEDMEGESWEEVCASLRDELAAEKTRSAGLAHEKGVQLIEGQFKDKEMESMRAKIERLEASVDEADAAREESSKEAEKLREEVDLLKTTMESRLRDIVKDINGELNGSKELVEHLQARLGVEQAKMDGRSKQLEDRINAFSVEEKALQRKISDRDAILQYTLQRLVRMAEATAENQDSGAAAWDAEVRQLREQMALQSAKELANDSNRKRSWTSGNTNSAHTDSSPPSDSSVGSSYDSASQAAIFQGEEGTMIATSAMQMCRKKRRMDTDE